jgi:HK97 family phage prohead protease
MKTEVRHWALTELRADAKGRITGHAAVFDSLSRDLGGFKERIRAGAFDDTLTDDVRALFNHDPNYVLGRSSAGTLSLAVDKRGLVFDIKPPATTWARDLLVSIRRGDIDQASFAFNALDESWEKLDGEPVRELRKLKLIDVSPVTYPAYDQTDVATRSFEAYNNGGPRREISGPSDGLRDLARWKAQLKRED